MELLVCLGLSLETCLYRSTTKERVGDQVERGCVTEASAISLRFLETSQTPKTSPGFRGKQVRRYSR